MDAECFGASGIRGTPLTADVRRTLGGQRAAGCKVHNLARADAQYGMHASLDEEARCA